MALTIVQTFLNLLAQYKRAVLSYMINFLLLIFMKKLKYAELHKTIAANSLHVLTQVLDRIPVHVIKDIPEMEKHAKVIRRDRHFVFSFS